MLPAKFVEVSDPFNPIKSMVVHEETPGMTILEWIKKRYGPKWEKFELPTIVNFNGKWVLQELWDKVRVWGNDVVQFIVTPGYEAIVYIVVLIVAVVVAIVMTPAPTTPGQPPTPDPVYSISGQYNRNRPGEPIEVPYGRNQLWPSYAARAYTRFENHEQIQYQALCLGHGYFDITKVAIEDTALENYPEATYWVRNPGESFTEFPDHVITSVEVGGIELFGTNEDQYPVSGWVGPFTINPPGTATTKIEIDLICPGGLYVQADGAYLDTEVDYTFEARLIDDAGDPLGSWFLLETAQLVDSTNDTRRYTREFTVAAGRYEVRGTRTDTAAPSSAVMSKTLWQGARAYLPQVGTYEGVTTLFTKIRATNNLNDNSRSRVNVIATRKLPAYDPEDGWLTDPADLVATRSPIMAFCDAFCSEYGGRLSRSYLDMDELMAMDAELAAAGIYFDWVFDQKTTLLEAARVICRVGRCIPMMAGSRLFMVRDKLQTTPVAMFTPSTIGEGSWRREIKLFEFDRYDSTVMEYIDEDTFETKEVTCTLPGGTADNPERMKLPGCTSRTVAYREGMYQSSVRRYLRTRLSFRTGLEGVIPTYGDLISVSHDVPNWGQSGNCLVMNAGVSSTMLQLSEPVDFQGVACKVMLRDRYGQPQGPYDCTDTGNPFTLQVDEVLDPDLFAFETGWERPAFTFGPVDRVSQLARITSIKPGSGEEVEIECVPYNPAVYDFDDADPPEE